MYSNDLWRRVFKETDQGRIVELNTNFSETFSRDRKQISTAERITPSKLYSGTKIRILERFLNLIKTSTDNPCVRYMGSNSCDTNVVTRVATISSKYIFYRSFFYKLLYLTGNITRIFFVFLYSFIWVIWYPKVCIFDFGI